MYWAIGPIFLHKASWVTIPESSLSFCVVVYFGSPLAAFIEILGWSSPSHHRYETTKKHAKYA